MNTEQRSVAEIILELIAPALIMVLVGSFVMFLVEVFYQGSYTARLDIILMLFTFAAVLIGRISIEQDHSVAALYAIVLGIVTSLAMVRFVELTGPLAAFSLPINVGLLAIVWFFTHKLVWDCTFVDMTKDVTATGLLDSVGSRWKKLRDAFDEVDQLASDEVNPIRPTTPNQPAAPWAPFLRWLRHRKANTPGLWVIYFAFLTMPIFGIAQGFIPASDLPSRRWVFQLFVAYILASLGLLMTTSLIGLMRYLHGRQVEMPNSLMISWISVGSVVGVALLCLAWLLPRPAPEYSIAKSLPFSFKTPDSTRPNSWALGSDGQKSGVQANSSRRNGQQGQSGQGQSGQGQSGQGQSGQGQSGQGQSGQGQSGQGQSGQGQSGQGQSGQGQSGQGQSGQGQSGQGQSGQGQSGQGQSGQGQSGQGQSGQGQSGQGQSGQGSFANGFSQFSLPPALTHVGTLIKILAAIALLTLLTWALLRYRKEILASYREWWSGLTRWWSLFLGRKSRQRRGIDPVSSVAVNPLRPFTTFSNPFRGNLADQLSPDELVAMSFTALESWAQDFGHPRHEDQTPIEFAKSLTCSVPELGPSAQAFTKLVNQSAYAPNTLDRKCLPTVKRLWDQLEKRVPSSSLQHAR